MSYSRMLVLIVFCTYCGGVSAESVFTLEPYAIGGVRSFSPDSTSGILLSFGAVKSIDRTVAHFSLTDIPASWESANLEIPLKNIDPGLPLGDMDVFAFFGDGIVSGDEWSAGSLYHHLDNIGGGTNTGPSVFNYEPSFHYVDISSLVIMGIESEHDFVSFVFRSAQSSDRYWMAPGSGTPAPTVEFLLVPEPSAFCLSMALVFSLCICRRRVGQTSRS